MVRLKKTIAALCLDHRLQQIARITQMTYSINLIKYHQARYEAKHSVMKCGFQVWHMKSLEVRECLEFGRIEVMEVKEVMENVLSGRSER